MTRQPTAELLLALCRGRLDGAAQTQAAALLARPVNWDALAELAALHGVVGLVRRNIETIGAADQVSPRAWQAIQAAATQIAFDSMLHSRQLAQVVAALRAAGIEPLALKGLALADLLYNDPAVRPSTDLDLLVRPEQLAAALAAMQRQGAQLPSQAEVDFQRRYSYDVTCALPATVGKRTLVELHWDLAPRGLFDLDLDRWRARSQVFDLDGARALRLAPEEQLLHLALHMRKHRYVGLRWLADVAELVRRFGQELDWRSIDAGARQAGLQTLLYVSLSLARQYLDAPVPPGWLAGWTPSPLRLRLLHSVVDQNALLTPVEMEDAGWTRLAPAEVLLLDRPGAMARELRYRLFPPPEKLAGFENNAAGVGKRLTLRAGRLANRSRTLLRR